MIRSENLRSGYIQDDVEEYIYGLLPERDAVVREMEDYAAQNRVPIIGPAVARMLALFVHISGAKRIFEMGSAIGYSTISTSTNTLARCAWPCPSCAAAACSSRTIHCGRERRHGRRRRTTFTRRVSKNSTNSCTLRSSSTRS